MVDNRGFTLFELIVTIALVGILVAIGTPSLLALRAGYQIRGAARQVYGDMQTARFGAIKEGRNWAICFAPGDTAVTSYTIRNQPGPDRNLCTVDDPLPYVRTVDLALIFPGLTFVENFPGTVLPFSFRGTASNGNVSVSNGARTLQVTVTGATGNARIQ